MEIDADPPAAENVVVVVPVMIWHPPGAVDEESSPHATAASRSATEQMARVRRKTRVRRKK
jgi:hypothetical protein